MRCYLTNVKLRQIYDGSRWQIDGIQRITQKAITDNAGFSNSWYDVSDGGVTIPVLVKLRLLISVSWQAYHVIGNTNFVVTSRVVRSSAVPGGGQAGTRLVQDLATLAYQVNDVCAATGNLTYRIDATTNFGSDIGITGLFTIDAVSMDP